MSMTSKNLSHVEIENGCSMVYLERGTATRNIKYVQKCTAMKVYEFFTKDITLGVVHFKRGKTSCRNVCKLCK